MVTEFIQAHHKEIQSAIKDAIHFMPPEVGRSGWQRGFCKISPQTYIAVTINDFEPGTALVYRGRLGTEEYVGEVKITNV